MKQKELALTVLVDRTRTAGRPAMPFKSIFDKGLAMLIPMPMSKGQKLLEKKNGEEITGYQKYSI